MASRELMEMEAPSLETLEAPSLETLDKTITTPGTGSTMTDPDLPTKAQIKAAFTKADKDGTGKLPAGTVKKMIDDLEGFKSSDEAFKFFMALADKDGDKMINYQEVIDFFYEEPDYKRITIAMFKIYDADGNGKLSRKEIAQMDLPFGPTVDEVLNKNDADGDGMISFEEYCKMKHLD